MRGTGGNDVNFAMDVPKEDSPDIAVLRAKGAIIFAVAAAANVGMASRQRAEQGGHVVPRHQSPICSLERTGLQPL
jgi:hypothetical protein